MLGASEGRRGDGAHPLNRKTKGTQPMKSLWMLAVLSAAAFAVAQEAAPDTDTLDLGALMQPADPATFYKQKEWFVWDPSVIRAEDGSYRLFFSRWPKAYSYLSWLTHAEVQVAKADRPEGPYGEARPVFRGRLGAWDAFGLYNPKICRFGSKFYLYYASTNDGGANFDAEKRIAIARGGYSTPEWKLLVRRQRPGVAIADSVDGPWRRLEAPIAQPNGVIVDQTVNPAVAQAPDGTYRIILKGRNPAGRKPWSLQIGGKADRPEGPYELAKGGVFRDFATEDATLWYDATRKRYYSVVHAHGYDFLALLTSEDGLSWRAAKHRVVCKKEIPLTDGTTMKVDRMERPEVYLENGRPKLLLVSVKRGAESWIVFFPLAKETAAGVAK